ncbi:MAG: hypothetical protein HON07_06340 [Planctomycetaceae bacterium]|nr:hypothetical protein [Planctomycetaceae bacterium]
MTAVQQQFDRKSSLPQDAGCTASIPPTEMRYDHRIVTGRSNVLTAFG